MKQMLLLLSTFLATQGCSLVSSAATSSEGLVLVLTQSSTNVRIKLHNASDHQIEVALPMVITIDGSISGLEFIFLDEHGGRHNLCASIQINSPPKPTILKRGDEEELVEDIRTLAETYCLSPGKYTLTAIFHNIVPNGTQYQAIRSNTLEFTATSLPR